MPLPPSDLSARVREWLEIVEDALAVRPMLYTSSGFWTAHMRANTWAGQYPLWIASYGTAAPLVPLPWAPFTWTMWQFNPKGDGGYYGAGSKSIDLNVRPGQDGSGGLHVV
jgi:GH25 family lysozyme M1 (1,4-beta-N-acetylmuramidase)